MPSLHTTQAALPNTQQTTQQVVDEILRAVQELKNGSGFGSIEIVIHEGRVTQIEKREKLRLQQTVTNLRK
ncbi:MAG: YezD family protein [Pseudomonadota bacterium]